MKLTEQNLSYPRHKKVEEIKIGNIIKIKKILTKSIGGLLITDHLTRNLIRHGDELGGLSSSLMIDYNIYYIEKGRSYIDM